ncbi:hypothetical protein D6T63_15095 [Arthrobacter cheniae]|uniref:Uncharacterized protein n=1 Tax=Arthrobacter cheniae TaxID=1258888 RepID=A0A3A5M2U5_9MICC|nr:hypothetical protein [Arthrobacter cheniae]RJT77265.1 hypothetical protein D6T63_15095 [Arthrobacter cheniae]
MESESVTECRVDGRSRRILSSAAVGLASLGLGLAAHVVSGGDLPDTPILFGLAALAVLAATLVSHGRLPGWAVMLVLGVAQQVLHWLLGGLADAPSSTVPGADGHHGGDVPIGTAAPRGHSPELMLMLHAHLAVALLVGWAVLQRQSVIGWLSVRRRPQVQRSEEGAPIT